MRAPSALLKPQRTSYAMGMKNKQHTRDRVAGYETKAHGVPSLLTVNQAAEALGVTAWTIREHLRSGKINGVKLGSRAWRIPTEELRRVATEGIQ